MPDDDAVRLHTAVFENIELLQGGFSRNAGVRKDGEIGLLVRLGNRAEDFALLVANLVPTADFAHHADRLRMRFLDDCVSDLILAPGCELGRIKRLSIKSAAGDDGHSGFSGKLLQKIEIPSHIRVTAV